MALTLGAGANDLIGHGNAANLNNLSTFTFLTWVYATTLTTNRILIAKTGGVLQAIRFRLNGTGGNVELQYTVAAGTNGSFISNTTPIATNAWRFVAATYDTGAGTKGHLYGGSLTAVASEVGYSATTNHSGTHDDSDSPITTGNNGAGGAVFQGRNALIMVFNRVLTLGEIVSLQFHPRNISGCVLYGNYYGTGTQPDWSGSGNVGTVTGATAVDHVPLRPIFAPVNRRAPYAVTVSTFLPRRPLLVNQSVNRGATY